MTHTDRHDLELYGQTGHDVRFDWGPNGLRVLAPAVDVLIIVDVLSFTPSVDVAVGRGATVLPYKWRDGGEEALTLTPAPTCSHPTSVTVSGGQHGGFRIGDDPCVTLCP